MNEERAAAFALLATIAGMVFIVLVVKWLNTQP